MILALIWLPGSGKWMISKRLASQYNFKVFTPGAEFRKLASKDPKLAQILNDWKLVPPHVAQKALGDFLKKHKTSKIVLDWYPRSLEQKEMLERYTQDYLGIYLKITPKIAFQRVATAMYNPITNERFPAHFTHDPKTGVKLQKRGDDNPQSLQKRIETFRQQTLPLIKELETQSKLKTIDASLPLEQVKKQILDIIDL